MRNLKLLLGLTVLAGCSTTVMEPMKIGKDSYTINVSHTAVGSGLTSHAELRQQALQSATRFCTSKSKELQVDSWDGSGIPGHGSIDEAVNFMCLDHAEQVKLRPKANEVIEVHNY